MQELKVLDLSYSRTVDDQLLQVVASMPNLERLSVRYCMEVTQLGIGELSKSSKLNCLDFSGCVNVECSVLQRMPSSIKWLRLEMLNLTGSHLTRLAASACG